MVGLSRGRGSIRGRGTSRTVTSVSIPSTSQQATVTRRATQDSGEDPKTGEFQGNASDMDENEVLPDIEFQMPYTGNYECQYPVKAQINIHEYIPSKPRIRKCQQSAPSKMTR